LPSGLPVAAQHWQEEKHDDQLVFAAMGQSGDAAMLTKLLAQDAVLYSDGGGKRAAALNPIYGADKILRFLIGIARKNPALPGAQWRPATSTALPVSCYARRTARSTPSLSSTATGASSPFTWCAIRRSCATSAFESAGGDAASSRTP
jgi:hypothetical protein